MVKRKNRDKNKFILALTTALALLVTTFNACLGPVTGGVDVASSVCHSSQSHSLFQFGNGTSAEPFVICNPLQFANLVNNPAFYGSNFLLAVDLDLSDSPQFEGIGVYDKIADPDGGVAFTGTFDGGGHTIANLNIVTSADSTRSAALFAYTDNATVKNLSIKNALVQANRYAGLMIGYAVNTNLENVQVHGQIMPFNEEVFASHIGCLVGTYIVESSQIRLVDSGADCVARGHDLVGNLIARVEIRGNNSSLNVTRSTTLGEVQGLGADPEIGGNTFSAFMTYVRFSGTNNNLTVSDSHIGANVNVIGTKGSWVGSFFSNAIFDGDGHKLAVLDSSTSGNISTPANFNVRGHIGGIVGDIVVKSSNTEINIERCFAKSNISIVLPIEGEPPVNQNLGGLIGTVTMDFKENIQMNIIDSFYTGTISASAANQVAGLVARAFMTRNTHKLNLVNSYAKIEKIIASGSNHFGILGSSGGVGKVQFSGVYWHSNTIIESDANSNANITKLNNLDINRQSSYLGWDFAKVWRIEENFSSPQLR